MRRRPRFAVVASLAAAVLLTAGACGDDDDGGGGSIGDPAAPAAGEYAMEQAADIPASPTLDAIQERGELLVGTKFDQPLFGLQNPINNEIEGFDTEIARLLALRIFGDAEKVEFTEAISRNREPYIQDGRVDAVVATYTINDARKELVAFAGPYYVAGQDIMVRSDNDSISGVDDLNGKQVCSVQGSTSEKNLAEHAPEADVLVFDAYSLCVEALRDGRVEAVSTDNVVLNGLIADAPEEFKLVGNPFTEEPYGIGVPRDDDVFRDFVNDTLELAYSNGDWAKAFESTVGTVDENTPEPPAVDRYEITPAA